MLFDGPLKDHPKNQWANVKLKYETIERLQDILGKPIQRNYDKAINAALDILEESN